MSNLNLISEVSQVAEKISKGEIFSSTEVVINSILAIKRLLEKIDDLNTLKEIYPLAIKKLFYSRQTSALLLNSLREITILIIDSLKENQNLKELNEKVSYKVKEIENKIKETNRVVARIASNRILDGDTILVYSYSTVLREAIKTALLEGKTIEIYLPESRPGSEGMIFAKELAKQVDVTLFVDSAIRYFIKDIDKVFTSSEAIAANGALINKVGTSILALVAHEARVRFFSLAATLKFYPETFLGELVELNIVNLKIEEEGKDIRGKIDAYSPLFDITPPEYIDAIITEKGLIAPQAVVMLIEEIYGWPPKIPSLESELKRLDEVI